jgi:hypothetical protein
MTCVSSGFTVAEQQVYPGAGEDTTRPIQLPEASDAWACYGSNTTKQEQQHTAAAMATV